MDTPAATPGVVAVAWSGGRDSTALLHAALHAARARGGIEVSEVAALHVHHGLSPNADGWLAHCERLAAQWRDEGLPLRFSFRRLALDIRPGDSLEAEARRGRYAALREMALEQGAREVWLAHHRRDQAETFLLQALRGAGVAGLSGMPRAIEREGILWVRPWLDQPREAVEAYLARHGLPYVDDDSNADTRLARNRLRLAVWPALSAAFSSAEGVLADSARHAQDASACLADLARIDLQPLLDPQGLDVPGLLALPSHRARNVLRGWFLAQADQPMPASLCERLMAELPQGGALQWPAPGGRLRLYRGRLAWRTGKGAAQEEVQRLSAGSTADQQDAEARHPAGSTLRLDVPGGYRLDGWAGVLHVLPVTERGVDPARLAEVRCGPRRGGEDFQLAPGRPARSLKKQYQALGLPSWQRGGPLLWSGEQLLYVPGLGIDARAWAAPGAPQFSLDWQPDEA